MLSFVVERCVWMRVMLTSFELAGIATIFFEKYFNIGNNIITSTIWS